MLSGNWAIDAINKGLAGSNRLAGFGNEVLGHCVKFCAPRAQFM
jgi:hypothetical protein